MDLEIDKLGRVVIPKPVRDRLHLAPGTRLRVEEQGEGLYLAPVHESADIVERDGLLIFTGKIQDPASLIDAVDRDREERNRRILG